MDVIEEKSRKKSLNFRESKRGPDKEQDRNQKTTTGKYKPPGILTETLVARTTKDS